MSLRNIIIFSIAIVMLCLLATAGCSGVKGDSIGPSENYEDQTSDEFNFQDDSLVTEEQESYREAEINKDVEPNNDFKTATLIPLVATPEDPSSGGINWPKLYEGNLTPGTDPKDLYKFNLPSTTTLSMQLDSADTATLFRLWRYSSPAGGYIVVHERTGNGIPKAIHHVGLGANTYWVEIANTSDPTSYKLRIATGQDEGEPGNNHCNNSTPFLGDWKRATLRNPDDVFDYWRSDLSYDGAISLDLIYFKDYNDLIINFNPMLRSNSSPDPITPVGGQIEDGNHTYSNYGVIPGNKLAKAKYYACAKADSGQGLYFLQASVYAGSYSHPDLPSDLKLIVSQGAQGQAKVILTNRGNVSITWSLTSESGDLAFDLANGYLKGGYSTQRTISLVDPQDIKWTPGSHDENVKFLIMDLSGNPMVEYIIPADVIIKAPTFGWARTWGGIYLDEGLGVAIDGSGNAYITGEFNDTADFDPGPGVDEHTSNGIYDIFLSKFDSNGDFQWARTWGGIGADYDGHEVAIDGSGNAYITGNFFGTVDFNPGPGVDEHTANARDAFLSKFDSNGGFQWARTWGGSGDEYGCSAYGVAVDGSGNPYITGGFNHTVDFNPGPGVDEHTTNGNNVDAFLSKFDSSGDFQWARTWGGSGDEYPEGIASDGSGNAYIIGEFYYTADFDPGPGVDEHISNGQRDIFLSKFDSNGDFHWARTWGGSDHDLGYGVAVDGSGNAYTTGYFIGTVDFDPGPGVDEHKSSIDAFLSKFDTNGDFQWARTWGGTSSGWGQGVTTDGDGNTYIIGGFQDTADFDPGPGVDAHTPNGWTDIFLSKFDSNGDFQWVCTWGGIDYEFGRGVAVAGSGDIYTTGWFEYPVDFDPGPGVDEHTSNGGYDIFLSKFSQDGN